ncbi:hypothetical protein B296_00031397 [Ensete ventricosum]|uniref:Uncharacterized protein n=1 Tax=Ensete ventricosum TaxID=4639 RepID=A0A426Z194_ENSVE|nr:hypothetical protein B296_00031397 [Ensete ventricosum]
MVGGVVGLVATGLFMLLFLQLSMLSFFSCTRMNDMAAIMKESESKDQSKEMTLFAHGACTTDESVAELAEQGGSETGLAERISLVIKQTELGNSEVGLIERASSVTRLVEHGCSGTEPTEHGNSKLKLSERVSLVTGLAEHGCSGIELAEHGNSEVGLSEQVNLVTILAEHGCSRTEPAEHGAGYRCPASQSRE